MNRILAYPLLAIAIVAVGWHYAPASMRDKTAALVTSLMRGTAKQDAQKAVEQKLLSQPDPTAQRADLINQLQQNLNTIRKDTANSSGTATPADIAATQQLLDQSDALIKQLQDSNQNVPLQQSALTSLINRVIPPASQPACK